MGGFFTGGVLRVGPVHQPHLECQHWHDTDVEI